MHVVRDTTLGGTDLPAGSHLLLLWAAANRDPAVFSAPGEIRLDRPAQRNHLAFGTGIHFCVGAALAGLEAAWRSKPCWLGPFRLPPDPDAAQWDPSIVVRRHHRLALIVE